MALVQNSFMACIGAIISIAVLWSTAVAAQAETRVVRVSSPQGTAFDGSALSPLSLRASMRNLATYGDSNHTIYFSCAMPDRGITCGVCAADSSGEPVLLFNLTQAKRHMPFSYMHMAGDRTKVFGVTICAGEHWDALNQTAAAMQTYIDSLPDDTIQPQPLDPGQCVVPSPSMPQNADIRFSGGANSGMYHIRPQGALSEASVPRGACYCHPDEGGECAGLYPPIAEVVEGGIVLQTGSFGTSTDGSTASVPVPAGSITWTGISTIPIQSAESDGVHHELSLAFAFASPSMSEFGLDWDESGIKSAMKETGCFRRQGITGRCLLVAVLTCDHSAFAASESTGTTTTGGSGTDDSGEITFISDKDPVISDSIRASLIGEDPCAIVAKRMGFDPERDLQVVCISIKVADMCLY